MNYETVDLGALEKYLMQLVLDISLMSISKKQS